MLYQKIPRGIASYWESSRLALRRPFIQVRFIVLPLTLCCVFLLTSYRGLGTMVYPELPIQNDMILSSNNTTRLSNIPPKIWQIYFDLSDGPDTIFGYKDFMHSWISKSPSYSYSVVDQVGALSIVSKLSASTHPHILPLFYSMSRRVLRADFLRYLVLALEGGVYSDMDTELLRPVHSWVPSEYRAKTKLIVGIEADQDPPVEGTIYPVQFCQWTLASTPSHPVLWAMIERILTAIKERPFQHPPNDVEYSDMDILNMTGPAGWTQTIMQHLSSVTKEELTWRNFTGMTRPELYGDVLVLPINGFASNVPHSGAHEGGEDAFVKHHFRGTWKGGQ